MCCGLVDVFRFIPQTPQKQDAASQGLFFIRIPKEEFQYKGQQGRYQDV